MLESQHIIEAYLGDYMDIDGTADKGVRYLSTGGDGVAFGYKINDNVHVWKKTLADKYPTLYQQDADEYIRQEFAKGRFVMIVMTTRDGDHMAIVDDVLPDGTIVMVDSGGGYKYWEGMKREMESGCYFCILISSKRTRCPRSTSILER